MSGNLCPALEDSTDQGVTGRNLLAPENNDYGGSYFSGREQILHVCYFFVLHAMLEFSSGESGTCAKRSYFIYLVSKAYSSFMITRRCSTFRFTLLKYKVLNFQHCTSSAELVDMSNDLGVQHWHKTTLHSHSCSGQSENGRYSFIGHIISAFISVLSPSGIVFGTILHVRAFCIA